jgi:hypothetical protein
LNSIGEVLRPYYLSARVAIFRAACANRERHGRQYKQMGLLKGL